MPNRYGTQRQLAKEMGVNETTICKWKSAGKLKGLIRKKDGKVNITKAKKELPGRVAPKQQQSQNIRWGKESKNPTPNTKAPETKEEIQSYLDESIGDLAKLNIAELQRRNELEKLLLQQIKRKKEEGKAVEVDAAIKTIEQILSVVVNGLESLAPKCGALVAAESDDFECRQIITKEVEHMRNQVSEEILQIGKRLKSAL